MEYRPLNIAVKSAEGLKNVKLLGKMNVYVEVSIAGYPQSVKRTRVDKNGGTSPNWTNDAGSMEFMVDEPYLTKPGLSLLFQIKARSSFRSDKEVGSAIVPIHDLFNAGSNQKTVEYRVHTPSGKPKGCLKFSYCFGEKFTHQIPAVPEAKQTPYPVTAYPASYAADVSAYPPPYHGAAAAYGAYPTQTTGYGYAPPPQGYGYPPPVPGAYGQPKKRMGAGLGLGLGAGLLGGLLVGEMASGIGESAAYADGYGDAMDGGGFDF